MLKPIDRSVMQVPIDPNDNRNRSLIHARTLRIDPQSTNDVIVVEESREVRWHVRRSSIAILEHSDFPGREVIMRNLTDELQ